MRFLIDRTSQYNGDAAPCDGAVRGPWILADRRTFASPDEMSERQRDDWFGRGTNHRIEDGRVVRDLPQEGWFVDVDALDDLLALATRLGYPLIVDAGSGWHGCPHLEVYDDYRE